MYQSSEWEEGGWGGVEEGEEGCRISITRLFRPTSLDATDASSAIGDHPHIFCVSYLIFMFYAAGVGHSLRSRHCTKHDVCTACNPTFRAHPKASRSYSCGRAKTRFQTRMQLSPMFINAIQSDSMHRNIHKINWIHTYCIVYRCNAVFYVSTVISSFDKGVLKKWDRWMNSSSDSWGLFFRATRRNHTTVQ